MHKDDQKELDELKLHKVQFLSQLQDMKAVQKENHKELEEMKKKTAQFVEQLAASADIHQHEQKKLEELEKTRDELKEDKRKLEHMLYDLFLVSEASKEKLKKIQGICND